MAAAETERSLHPSAAIGPTHAAQLARPDSDDADLKRALELSSLEKVIVTNSIVL